MPRLKIQPQQISRDELGGRFTLAEKENFYAIVHGNPIPPGPPPTDEDGFRMLGLLAYMSREYLFVDDPILWQEFNYMVTLGILDPGRPAILLAI